jgi:hypothetical protein
MTFVVRYLEVRYRIDKIKERMIRRLVWRLPRSVILWSTVRAISNATTGPYENQVVPELTAMDTLERWGT